MCKALPEEIQLIPQQYCTQTLFAYVLRSEFTNPSWLTRKHSLMCCIIHISSNFHQRLLMSRQLPMWETNSRLELRSQGIVLKRLPHFYGPLQPSGRCSWWHFSCIIAADVAVHRCRGRWPGTATRPLWPISVANCSGLYVTDTEAVIVPELRGLRELFWSWYSQWKNPWLLLLEALLWLYFTSLNDHLHDRTACFLCVNFLFSLNYST